MNPLLQCYQEIFSNLVLSNESKKKKKSRVTNSMNDCLYNLSYSLLLRGKGETKDNNGK